MRSIHRRDRWLLLGTLALTLVSGAGAPAVAGPAEAGFDCRKSWDALREGRVEEAAEEFGERARREPVDGCAAEGRVVALIELRRWREALDEAKSYRQRGPGNPAVVAALGEALYRAGELEGLRRLLEPLAELERPSARALTLLGLVSVAEGEHEEAVDWMDRAVSIAPDDRSVLFRAAEAARSRAEATRRLERYLELSEGDDADRIEGARGRLEMLRALGERKVWIVDANPERVELPLQLIPRSGGGVGGAVVKVGVGEKDKPVRLLLDSGSSGLFLVERMARKRGFEQLAVETAFGGGGDKRHASPRGVFSAVSVGELRFRDALASTTSVEFDPTGRYHGVLGLPVFDGYVVTIDLQRGRLVLERRDRRVEGSPYWTVSGQMLVRAAAREAEQALFLLDTGASSSVLDLHYAERVPQAVLDEGASLSGYGGAIGRAFLVRGSRLEFQGLDTGESMLRATDLSLRSHLGGVQLGGFLGLDLLGGRSVVVDTVGRQIRVERAR